MKRVLFASVFAAIALAANAQTQEVLRSNRGFNVIPKALTTNGNNILYSTDYDGNSVTYTYNIYDDNFLQTKSLCFIGNKFPYKRFKMKALAPITKKTVNSVEYDGVYSGDTLTVKTMDELVDWLQQRYYFKISKDSCFYDYEGNMAFYREGDWQSVQNKTDVDGKPAAIIRESYNYYNKTDKKIHRRYVVLTAEFDMTNLNWEIDKDQIIYENNNGESLVDNIVFKDFDNSQCNEGWNAKISQTLFNNDDKYEYVVRSCREISAPSDQNTTFDNGLTLSNEMEDGKLVINKEEYDHYYQSYLYVADEDGNKLFDLPDTSSSTINIYKLNGKLLIETEDYSNFSISLYFFNPETAGISEVARSQSAPSDIFYNAAGIQVSKKAKGLVIQKDGKKFINR